MRSRAVAMRSRMAAMALAALACACSKTAQPAATARSSPAARGPVYHISANGQAGRPVRIANIIKGVTEYALEANSVIYATDLRKGRFQDTTLHFYKGRKPRLTVTAPTAVVDEVSHDISLTGGVHAATAGGVTLTSDAMRYDEKTRLLTAIGHVVAVEPGGDMLTGTRAIADLDLQSIHLFGAGPIGAQASAAAVAAPTASP